MPEPELLACSFCGKAKADVRDLIRGPIANICNECIALCVDILLGTATLADAKKERE